MSGNLQLYKTYLENLNKLSEYDDFLKKDNKKDNNTNMKLFFNNHVHISIIDYINGEYGNQKSNRSELIRYLRKNKNKIKKRGEAKKEKYNIFLKTLN